MKIRKNHEILSVSAIAIVKTTYKKKCKSFFTVFVRCTCVMKIKDIEKHDSGEFRG